MRSMQLVLSIAVLIGACQIAKTEKNLRSNPETSNRDLSQVNQRYHITLTAGDDPKELTFALQEYITDRKQKLNLTGGLKGAKNVAPKAIAGPAATPAQGGVLATATNNIWSWWYRQDGFGTEVDPNVLETTEIDDLSRSAVFDPSGRLNTPPESAKAGPAGPIDPSLRETTFFKGKNAADENRVFTEQDTIVARDLPEGFEKNGQFALPKNSSPYLMGSKRRRPNTAELIAEFEQKKREVANGYTMTYAEVIQTKEILEQIEAKVRSFDQEYFREGTREQPAKTISKQKPRDLEPGQITRPERLNPKEQKPVAGEGQLVLSAIQIKNLKALVNRLPDPTNRSNSRTRTPLKRDLLKALSTDPDPDITNATINIRKDALSQAQQLDAQGNRRNANRIIQKSRGIIAPKQFITSQRLRSVLGLKMRETGEIIDGRVISTRSIDGRSALEELKQSDVYLRALAAQKRVYEAGSRQP